MLLLALLPASGRAQGLSPYDSYQKKCADWQKLTGFRKKGGRFAKAAPKQKLTMTMAEYQAWLRDVARRNPDKTWQEIITNLHKQHQTSDDRLWAGPVLGYTNIPGPENDNFQGVDVGCYATSPTGKREPNTPARIVDEDGRVIDVTHVYAALRSDMNRDKNSVHSMIMRCLNGTCGDLGQHFFQEEMWDTVEIGGWKIPYWWNIYDKWGAFIPADQYRGNRVGWAASQIFRGRANYPDMDWVESLLDAFRREGFLKRIGPYTLPAHAEGEAKEKACAPTETVNLGPDKDGFVPVTTDPDAKPGKECPPDDTKTKTAQAFEYAPGSQQPSCKEIISDHQRLVRIYGGVADRALDQMDNADIHEERARNLWKERQCYVEANVNSILCRDAKKRVEESKRRSQERKQDYEQKSRLLQKFRKVLMTEIEKCGEAPPAKLVDDIRRAANDAKRRQEEQAAGEGEKVIGSSLDEMLHARKKATARETDKERAEKAACERARAHYNTARQHYDAGDTGAYKAGLVQADSEIARAPAGTCGGLRSKIAKGHEQARILEEVNAEAGQLLSSCKSDNPRARAAQMRKLSTLLSNSSQPHVQKLKRRLDAAQRATVAYANTKDAFRDADLERANRLLGGAQASLGTVEAQDCPDLRAALSKAPKVIDHWRGRIEAIDRISESCDIPAMSRYRSSLGKLDSPIAGTLVATLNIAIADCQDRKPTCPAGHSVGEKLANGKSYCIPTQATADARCTKINGGREHKAVNFKSNGTYDCMTTKAAANAWCIDNNGAGWYAANIKADGTHGCRPTKAHADASCRKSNPGHKGIYAAIKPDGSYTCRQTSKAAAAKAKADGHRACQRANNDRRVRASRYLGNGQWSCYLPGQNRNVRTQPRPRVQPRTVPRIRMPTGVPINPRL